MAGGLPLWTNSYYLRGGGDSVPKALVADSAGNVFVTGYSAEHATWPDNNDYLTVAYAKSGTPLWTNRYNGPGNDEDQAFAASVDAGGNVFVTGFSTALGGNGDYTTLAYSPAGVPLWTNRYDGVLHGFDQATAVAADGQGKVFVTGYTAPSGAADHTTLCYASDGATLWTNHYLPGGGNAERLRMTLDGAGNVIVAGQTGLDSSTHLVTVAYSAAGVPLWTNLYGARVNSTENLTGVAADRAGNVFVAGSSTGTNGYYDYVTLAYSAAGLPLWTNRLNLDGKRDARACGLAVDGHGNVFVSGYSTRTNGYPQYATVAYSGAGLPLWTNAYSTQGAGDTATALGTDRDGNVFVTGYSSVSAQNAYATVAYSGAGIPLWTNFYHGSAFGAAYPSALTVDADGNVLVTGYSTDTAGLYDYVTIKYSSSLVAPARLDSQMVTNRLVLTWTNAGFTLQAAPTPCGPFTNLPGPAGSYAAPLTGPSQYFRLKQEP